MFSSKVIDGNSFFLIRIFHNFHKCLIIYSGLESRLKEEHRILDSGTNIRRINQSPPPVPLAPPAPLAPLLRSRLVFPPPPIAGSQLVAPPSSQPLVALVPESGPFSTLFKHKITAKARKKCPSSGEKKHPNYRPQH